MKVYLAGPDIFAPDAKIRFNTKKQLLKELGHQPITPYESKNAAKDNSAREAFKIAHENEKLTVREEK